MTRQETQQEFAVPPEPRVTVPEMRKKTGVHYAVTAEGLELPVFDMLHPAFDDIPDAAGLERIVDRHLEMQGKFARLPLLLRNFMMWNMSRKSILVRALRGSSRSFLPGISTYIMKLGPGNLGQGYTGVLDHKIVASAPATSLRIRMRNMARLAADAARSLLEAHPGRPLQVLNIAGGPAMDTLNMLRLLHHERPELLEGRLIRIHVLDPDRDGPVFGSRALAAWTGPVGPLHGLNVSLEHHAYDWSAPESLEGLSAPWALGESVVLACSEGGLFEYGSDAIIKGNLAVLGRLLPPGAVVVGSVTREGPVLRLMIKASVGPHPTQPRTLEGFTALVREAGWSVETALENVMSLDVRLARSVQ